VRTRERTVVHTARAHSPLKLLLPRNHGTGAWVYVATLGGGLVDGDVVALDVDVGPGASALLGTQASTKVYRSPRGTSQRMRARVGGGGLLAVLSDPVSCFAGARYEQRIDVDLADEEATLVLVDTLTCGRAARGERWAFARYASRTRVSRAGRVVVIDAALLDPAHGDVATRVGKYDAFATVIAVGPRAGGVRAGILAAAAAAPVTPSTRLMTATSLGPDATLARLAATSAQEAIATVRALVQPVARELGDDPFARRW
jgi:urease accessory protein